MSEMRSVASRLAIASRSRASRSSRGSFASPSMAAACCRIWAARRCVNRQPASVARASAGASGARR